MKRMGLGVLLAVAVLAGSLSWQRHHAASAEAGRSGQVVAADAETADLPASPPVDAGDALARRQAQLGRDPLPPLDAPVSLVFDDLRSRARQGDARAACRLATEALWCDGLAARQQQLRVLMQAPRAQPVAGDVRARLADNFAEQLSLVGRQFEEHCGNAPVLSAAQRADYWRQAALAGHVPSMRHYAVGNAFRFKDLLDTLPELARYRQEAEGIAVRAAAAGDVQTLYALAMAYSEGSAGGYRPFLAQVVRPDAARALVWFRKLEQQPSVRSLPRTHPLRAAVEGNIRTMENVVTPQELQRAQDEVPQDDPSGPALGSDMGNADFVPHANGGLDDVDRRACDDQASVSGR